MIFKTDENDITRRAREVRLLVLDVDGVLTGGELFLSDSGEEMKAFNTLDGQGIKLLQSSGVQVGIISGRKSALLARRAESLGIRLLMQGREDKLNALQEMCAETGLTPAHIAYAGDDLPDIRPMKAVRLAIAVANAHSSVKESAHVQTSLHGGQGAVREICDFILQAQDRYDSAIAHFL
jgi:3-deoxy-D-manno-octulosonate 8-phosphate phosphatase (KDO 8-P phosphatase)